MTQDDHPAPVSPWLVPVLSATAFIGMLGLLTLGPFLPVMAADLNTSVALLGQVPALAMLMAAALGLIVGPLADQYGHRRALLVGLVTVSTSAIATSLAPTYLVLLLAVLVDSVGRAVIIPVSQAVAGSRFSGAAQRRAISWVISGISGSAILGVPLLTTIASASNWRIAFMALALATLVVALLMLWLMEPDRQPLRARLDMPDIRRDYAALLRYRPTLGILASSLVGNAGIWVMATYLGAFLVQRHASSTHEVGGVYLAIGLAFLAGSLLAGGRLGRLPPRPLLLGMRLLGGVFLALAFLLPLPALPVVTFILIGTITNGVSVVVITLVLSAESPAGQATTLTLNGSLLSLGIALGSALGGLLLVVGDYPALGGGILALLVGAAGLIWWSRPAHVSVSAPVVPRAGAAAAGERDHAAHLR